MASPWPSSMICRRASSRVAQCPPATATASEMMQAVHRIVVMSLLFVVVVAGDVTIALAAPDRANTPITKTEALAFTQAVNLRTSDLAGSTKFPPGESSQDISPGDGLHCGRLGRLRSRPVAREASLLVDNFELVFSG